MIRRISLVAVITATLAAACGDDTTNIKSPDGGTTPSPSPTTAPSDAGPLPDGAVPDAGRRSCLDRPNSLPRPPGSGLPCELIPPGLTL